MPAAACSAACESVEFGRAVAADRLLELGSDRFDLVPALRNREGVAVKQVPTVEQKVGDVDAGQSDNLSLKADGSPCLGGGVGKRDPVPTHELVQPEHSSPGCEVAQHDLVATHEIERRIVVGEGPDHLVEHGFDQSDARLVPDELRLDAGLALELLERVRQVAERPPVFLVNPHWPCHVLPPRSVERSRSGTGLRGMAAGAPHRSAGLFLPPGSAIRFFPTGHR